MPHFTTGRPTHHGLCLSGRLWYAPKNFFFYLITEIFYMVGAGLIIGGAISALPQFSGGSWMASRWLFFIGALFIFATSLLDMLEAIWNMVKFQANGARKASVVSAVLYFIASILLVLWAIFLHGDWYAPTDPTTSYKSNIWNPFWAMTAAGWLGVATAIVWYIAIFINAVTDLFEVPRRSRFTLCSTVLLSWMVAATLFLCFNIFLVYGEFAVGLNLPFWKHCWWTLFSAAVTMAVASVINLVFHWLQSKQHKAELAALFACCPLASTEIKRLKHVWGWDLGFVPPPACVPCGPGPLMPTADACQLASLMPMA